jgi:nitroreductase
MEVKDAINKRRSIRKYGSEPVADEIIKEIIEAARLAPSGCNAQPWRFYVINKKQTLEHLKAKKAFRQNFVYSVPVIIVCCGDPDTYSGKHGGEYQVEEGSVPKDEKARKELFSIVEGQELLRTVRDVSIASAFIVLRATELGLDTSFIGLINEPVLHEVLHIPENFVIPFVLLAGYSQNAVPQRPRKPLQEILELVP